MKLIIATPFRDALTSEYVLSLMNLIFNLSKSKTIKSFGYLNCRGTFIHNNRNELYNKFLDETDGDALLFVDSDIEFTIENIDDLISLNKPVTSGLYMSRWMNFPVVFRLMEHDRIINVRIDEIPDEPFCWDDVGVGCGFLLIKRNILELFRNNIILKQLGSPFDFADSQKHGEDMYFCRRLHTIGVPIWVHPGVKLGHVGKKVFYPQVEDMMMSDFLGGMFEDQDY